MAIAFTGATGHLGRLVLNRLKDVASSDGIIALARDPAKAADLGVPVRQADYGRIETIEPALAGVDTLLLISSSEVGRRAEQHANVISAAKTAGVERIVYTSLLRADTSPLALADEHRSTEALLKASGVAFTLLRNGWYAENHAASIKGALAAGAYIGSAGEGRIGWATRADFAEAAVAALTGDGHAGKTYELAGDTSHTLAELAAEVSRQTGTNVVYRDLAEADYASALLGFGLPEPLARMLAESDAWAAKGALEGKGHDLSELIGRPTTPLSAIVTAALA